MTMKKSLAVSISSCLLVLLAISATGSVSARETTAGPVQPEVIVVHDLKHDLSPPLREIVPVLPDLSEAREIPLLRHEIGARGERQESVGDAALQTTYGPNAMPATIEN